MLAASATRAMGEQRSWQKHAFRIRRDTQQQGMQSFSHRGAAKTTRDVLPQKKCSWNGLRTALRLALLLLTREIFVFSLEIPCSMEC